MIVIIIDTSVYPRPGTSLLARLRTRLLRFGPHLRHVHASHFGPGFFDDTQRITILGVQNIVQVILTSLRLFKLRGGRTFVLAAEERCRRNRSPPSPSSYCLAFFLATLSSVSRSLLFLDNEYSFDLLLL